MTGIQIKAELNAVDFSLVGISSCGKFQTTPVTVRSLAIGPRTSDVLSLSYTSVGAGLLPPVRLTRAGGCA